MKPLFRRLMRPLLEHQVKRLIARKRLRLVAVTGAVGKTSTKLAIATVLQQKYRVLVHPGNFNADISLPLAVFEQAVPSPIINPLAWLKVLIRMERTLRGPYPYDVLVLELGTDHPGEIPHFLTYLRPEIGVVTAVAAEHMENFHTLEAVAAEELALVAGSARALVNRDDVASQYWQRYVAPHPKHFAYGLHKGYDYGLEIAGTDPVSGTKATCYERKQAVLKNITFGRYGSHSAKAVAAAYAVGRLMDLSPKQLTSGLEAIVPVSGRMQSLQGINGSIIIDDTYNSSPEAAVAAVSALESLPVPGRRWLVMGSMNELGADSPRFHTEVGSVCTKVDMLVTIGRLANEYLGPAAVQAGLDREHWQPFDSPYAAGQWLGSRVADGDAVLAKGSQNGVFAEEAIKPLLANAADAVRLVRQSPDWMRRKAAQFPDSPR